MLKNKYTIEPKKTKELLRISTYFFLWRSKKTNYSLDWENTMEMQGFSWLISIVGQFSKGGILKNKKKFL